jgi:hypothetical protein
MLPKEAITEFRETYQKEFGVSISFEEAQQKAENFIQLFELISKPFSNDEQKEGVPND